MGGSHCLRGGEWWHDAGQEINRLINSYLGWFVGTKFIIIYMILIGIF